MDDRTDTYLRISLANWAAQQKPPQDGRERLIQQAALCNLISATGLGFSDSSNAIKEPLFYEKSDHLPEEWLLKSLTVKQLWYLHIASPVRFPI